ncbi:hypothetical protein LINPERPRIM_LOCUS9932 [Linum perenne]
MARTGHRLEHLWS